MGKQWCERELIVLTKVIIRIIRAIVVTVVLRMMATTIMVIGNQSFGFKVVLIQIAVTSKGPEVSKTIRVVVFHQFLGP